MLVGSTSLLPELYLTTFDNLEFLVRIVFAGILGGIIGYERTKRQKDAGIRTHCIIAVASATFMILSKYAFMDLALLDTVGSKGADPSRIASQVVTGISFLGAGVIFKNNRFSIRGLTTAAGIWATAALGMAVGAGLYWVGIIATAALSVIQLLLHRFPVGNDSYIEQEVSICMEEDEELMAEFIALIHARRGEIVSSRLKRGDGELSAELTIRIESGITHEESLEFLHAHERVKQISV